MTDQYIAVRGRIGMRWANEAIVFFDARVEGSGDKCPFTTMRVKLDNIIPWPEQTALEVQRHD